MDKIIEKKKGIAAAFTAKALKWWGLGVITVLAVFLILSGGRSVLR